MRSLYTQDYAKLPFFSCHTPFFFIFIIKNHEDSTLSLYVFALTFSPPDGKIKLLNEGNK